MTACRRIVVLLFALLVALTASARDIVMLKDSYLRGSLRSNGVTYTETDADAAQLVREGAARYADSWTGIRGDNGEPLGPKIISGEAYGAAPNKSATNNVNAIQSALNIAHAAGGGEVSIQTCGTYNINATLIIYSNTHWNPAPCVRLHNSSGAHMNLFANYAATTAWASVTESYTSGLTASVAWTAHGLAVGDYVWIANMAVAYGTATSSSATLASVTWLNGAASDGSSVPAGTKIFGGGLPAAGVTATGGASTITLSVAATSTPGESEPYYTADPAMSGIFRVSAVADANNFTVQLYRRPKNASSFTITQAKKCDTNIIIDNLDLDYDQANNNTGGGNMLLHAGVFAGVQNFTMRNSRGADAPKYLWAFAGLRDFRLDGFNVHHATSDGIKLYGPLFDGTLSNEYGNTDTPGDDFISIQPDESNSTYYPAGYQHGGDILGVIVDGLFPISGYSGIAVYVHPVFLIDNIKIKRVFGKSDSVELVKISGGSQQTGVYGIGTLGVEGVQQNVASAYGGVLINGTFQARTINLVDINGPEVGTNGSTDDPIIRSLSQTATIDNLNIVRGSMIGVGSGTPVYCQIATKIGNVIWEGGNISAPGLGFGYGINIVTAGASDNNIVVRNLTAQNVTAAVAIDTALNANNRVTIESSNLNVYHVFHTTNNATVTINNDVIQGGSQGIVRNTGANTVTATISNDKIAAGVIHFANVSGNATINAYLTGNDDASTAFLTNTAGNTTYNLRSAGNNYSGGAPVFTITAGTPVFNVFGFDLQVDVGATGFNKTTVGQFCLNTSAGGARGTLVANNPVMNNGTNWIQTTDTTKSY